MKTYFKNTISLLAVCTLGLTSCLDLDPVVNDKIIPENYFQNEDDARAAVTAIYNPFVAGWGGSIFSAHVASYFMESNLLQTKWDYSGTTWRWWNVSYGPLRRGT